MTLTVNTNTYTSMSGADTYFGIRPFSTSWTSAASSLKEACLITSTLHLDLMWDWRGLPTDEDQALAWPRQNIYSRNGAAIDEDTVPDDIIKAQLELAYQWVQADQLTAPGTHLTGSDTAAMKGGVKVEKVGSLMREYFGPPTMFGYSGAVAIVRKRYPLVDMLVRNYVFGRADFSQFPLIVT